MRELVATLTAVRALPVAAALWIGVGASAHAAEPVRPDAARVRQEVERVLSDSRFQRARPDGSMEPTEHEPPSEPFKLPSYGPHDYAPSAASGVSEALLWVLLAVFGAAIVAILAREGMRFARGRAKKKRKRAGAAAGEALDLSAIALEKLPATLARAKALAAEGRFEEAVHVLLEGALAYLHALDSFSLEPAFTSREVLARAPLTSELRRAFGELVMAVEVSLFGGLAVASDDFERCESSFVTLHRRLGGAHAA